MPMLFASCASTKTQQGIGAGELKNSLPVFEKNLLEDVGSIAVLPFYGDKYNWKNVTYNVLLSKSKTSVISNEKTERAVKENKKDISNLKPDNRVEILSRIGRSLQSDAVLNGVILSSGGNNEIVLQLVSSIDGRILWWQAVNFQLEDNQIARSEQILIIRKMLEPVFLHLGKSSKSKIIDKTPETDKKSIEISPM
ncbi:MAG: hypothetical protein LLF28_07710 [Nitrospiraceae bacterium]|nr:hypothetical protein [Nitrospiraceae bacterium]